MHKVLVVDDDKVLQQSVKQALVFHHFDVDVADVGVTAGEVDVLFAPFLLLLFCKLPLLLVGD